jgi:UDP-GlcNAc:undecaprenyl-phosphate GlcNAc-1-phosphate transferase
VTAGLRRFVAGAGTAWGAERLLLSASPSGSARWVRSNHRGHEVSLLSGPALAVAMPGWSSSPLPAAIAAVGAAGVGRYDDAVGGADDAKGFRGHLAALRHGRLTAGSVKVVGIGVAGLLASGQLRPRGAADALLGGAVIAASANLLNLLDLRPGRALKAGTALALVLREPGVAGCCAGLLPADLREQTMLGDAGANALGAVLGVGLVSRLTSRPGRLAALVALGALTAASERISYSAVIDATPPLRWLDRLGRRA